MAKQAVVWREKLPSPIRIPDRPETKLLPETNKTSDDVPAAFPFHIVTVFE
jgi:hypothetical protein